MPFEIKGDQAQWRYVYDRLRQMNIGDVVTDEELAALLPDEAAHESWRGAFFRAKQEMQVAHSRSFARVRNKGYRMVRAVEHIDLAKQQHKKAKNRIKAAILEARSGDRGQLSREERQRLDAIELWLAQQADNIKRIDERQAKTEERVALAEKDQAALADRMDRVEELMRRRFGEDDGDGSEESSPIE